jgi:DNA-binding GntR family transcriptional regulator
MQHLALIVAKEDDLTVYRRPDPIPRRPEQAAQQTARSLQAVRSETDDLHHLVARKIYSAIAGGHFPEGSILPNEQALGETLGVSRTALREAVKGLSSKGMLETRRRRGTMVLDRSHWTQVDGEVINWSRNDGDSSISEELWQGLTLVMPELARLASVNPLRVRLGAASSLDGQRTLAVATLLTEIARLSGNRFLTSLACISLISLARDDRPFLDKRLGSVSEGTIEVLRRAVASGDGEAAARVTAGIFDRVEHSEDASGRLPV